jgi:hypothetical protein
MICRKKYESDNFHIIDLKCGVCMTMCMFFMLSCADIHTGSTEIPTAGSNGDSMILFL